MRCDICKGESGCGKCRGKDAYNEKRLEYIRVHCPLMNGTSSKCLACKTCAVVNAPGQEESK